MIPSRIKRVEELVKEQVALIIQRDVKDPRLDFVTLTAVTVSKDLRYASIYVTIHNESKDHIDSVLEGLQKAAGFIRRELGQRIMLRYLPELHFFYDNTLKTSSRIDEILHQIHDENKNAPSPVAEANSPE